MIGSKSMIAVAAATLMACADARSLLTRTYQDAGCSQLVGALVYNTEEVIKMFEQSSTPLDKCAPVGPEASAKTWSKASMVDATVDQSDIQAIVPGAQVAYAAYSSTDCSGVPTQIGATFLQQPMNVMTGSGQMDTLAQCDAQAGQLTVTSAKGVKQTWETTCDKITAEGKSFSTKISCLDGRGIGVNQQPVSAAGRTAVSTVPLLAASALLAFV